MIICSKKIMFYEQLVEYIDGKFEEGPYSERGQDMRDVTLPAYIGMDYNEFELRCKLVMSDVQKEMQTKSLISKVLYKFRLIGNMFIVPFHYQYDGYDIFKNKFAEVVYYHNEIIKATVYAANGAQVDFSFGPYNDIPTYGYFTLSNPQIDSFYYHWESVDRIGKMDRSILIEFFIPKYFGELDKKI